MNEVSKNCSLITNNCDIPRVILEFTGSIQYIRRRFIEITSLKNILEWQLFRNTVMYPKCLGGDQFQLGIWGRVMQPYGSGSKTPGSFKDLVLWNNLLLIKIYPPQLVMELIPHIFFKILPKFKFKINFSVQIYFFKTQEDPTYLQITYHYVYYLKYTKKLFWVRSLGNQTGIPASKSLWIHLCNKAPFLRKLRGTASNTQIL